MYYIDDVNDLQLKDQRGYILGSMKAKNLLDELATLGVLVVEYDRSASQNRWARKHEVTCVRNWLNEEKDGNINVNNGNTKQLIFWKEMARLCLLSPMM